MEFKQLYCIAIKLWPIEIDISDGEPIDISNGEPFENGILFRNLSKAWDTAEKKAKKKGEWIDLMTWIIFRNLHRVASKKFYLGIEKIAINEVDIRKIKEDLIENLQEGDYKDMFKEFEKNDPPGYASRLGRNNP